MKVNQKISDHTYGAIGIPFNFGQHGSVVYKDLAYGRLKVYTLKNNSYMESHPFFRNSRNVVGWFNFIGPKKIRLENGFEADVLELTECPHVHTLIEKERREQKEADAKYKKRLDSEKKAREIRRQKAKAREFNKKKEFESLFE